MQHRPWLAANVIALLVLVTATSSLAADAIVNMELVTSSQLPLTAAQQWMAALSDVGFSGLRIRSARSGDRPQIETVKRDSVTIYRVTGVVGTRNILLVPGGGFTLRDTKQIKQWLEKLRQGGEQAVLSKTAAFGLTGRELLDLHKQLAAKVSFSTREATAGTIVKQLRETFELPIRVDSAAKTALANGPAVGEEYLHMSSGTALAATLRPLGLVMVPQKNVGSRQIVLEITHTSRVEESWPVGWPPTVKDRKLLPKLFDYLPVEIQDQPVSVAVEAICSRLKVPVLYDQNSLARHGIKPSTAKVNVRNSQTYYRRILDRVLIQARLTGEFRVDEAEQPFLWITTLKR